MFLQNAIYAYFHIIFSSHDENGSSGVLVLDVYYYILKVDCICFEVSSHLH